MPSEHTEALTVEGEFLLPPQYHDMQNVESIRTTHKQNHKESQKQAGKSKRVRVACD